jgi:hypothetical protein
VITDPFHTFASTALANAVPISEVSRWLGHKSITITVDLYGHLVPEASARARDALDNAFAAARKATPTPATAVPRCCACAPVCPHPPRGMLRRSSGPRRRGEPACRPGSVPRVAARRRSSI